MQHQALLEGSAQPLLGPLGKKQDRSREKAQGAKEGPQVDEECVDVIPACREYERGDPGDGEKDRPEEVQVYDPPGDDPRPLHSQSVTQLEPGKDAGDEEACRAIYVRLPYKVVDLAGTERLRPHRAESAHVEVEGAGKLDER